MYIFKYCFDTFDWFNLLGFGSIAHWVCGVYGSFSHDTGTGINPASSFGAAVIFNNEKVWDDHVSILVL